MSWHNFNRTGRNNSGNSGRNRHGFQDGGTASCQQHDPNQWVYYHWKKLNHTIHTYWLLHGKSQQNFQFANFVT